MEPALQDTRSDFFLYFMGVFAVLIAIEIWWEWHHGRSAPDWRDKSVNVITGLASVAASKLWMLALLPVFLAAGQVAVFRISLANWWVWPLALLAADFCHYWAHRFGHETRIGWAAHVTHHSSAHYDLTVAIRQPWTQHIYFVFFLPPVLLGIPLEAFLVGKTINTIYQFWIHTEHIRRLPAWAEYLFNTPSHHRVHHGCNPRYLDKNYAGIFILWDRLFGTFEPEDAAEPVQYGLTTPVRTYNPLRLQFHGWSELLGKWATARHWRDSLGYIIHGPAWQPPQRLRYGKWSRPLINAAAYLWLWTRTKPIRRAAGWA